MLITSKSHQETQKIASQFLDNYLKSNVIALIGDLGTGKTTFTQGLAKELGISEIVKSPTFLLMKSYTIPNHPRFNQLVHLDLYRVNSFSDIHELGLEEIFKKKDALILLKWAERIRTDWPHDIQEIKFQHVTEHTRNIEFED